MLLLILTHWDVGGTKTRPWGTITRVREDRERTWGTGETHR